MVELTDEQKHMFDSWVTLSLEQKQVLQELIAIMKKG